MTLMKKPVRPWQTRAQSILDRLLSRLKLVVVLLPLLLFWLPLRFKVSLLFILACVLALVSSVQRLPWLRPGRWRVVRSPWRRPNP